MFRSRGLGEGGDVSPVRPSVASCLEARLEFLQPAVAEGVDGRIGGDVQEPREIACVRRERGRRVHRQWRVVAAPWGAARGGGVRASEGGGGEGAGDQSVWLAIMAARGRAGQRWNTRHATRARYARARAHSRRVAARGQAARARGTRHGGRRAYRWPALYFSVSFHTIITPRRISNDIRCPALATGSKGSAVSSDAKSGSSGGVTVSP